MTEKKHPHIKTIIVVVILTVFAFFAIRSLIRRNKLRDDHLFTTGTITEVIAGHRGGSHVNFSFIVNNKEIKSSAQCSIAYGNATRILNRNFPVIYFPNDPALNQILITPGDFSLYNITFPDSLNWIKQIQLP